MTDDRFPCQNNNKVLFAQPHNNEIWVLLLEKCWAKIFYSFKAIEGGSLIEGLVALTGAPCELIFHDTKADEKDFKNKLINAQ